jgi:hypothetical protein
MMSFPSTRIYVWSVRTPDKRRGHVSSLEKSTRPWSTQHGGQRFWGFMHMTYRFVLSRCVVACAWAVFATTVAFAQTPPPGGPPPGAPPLAENPLLKFKVVDAKPGDVRPMTTALMGPIEAVRGHRKGHWSPLYIEYGSSVATKSEISTT